MQPGRGKDHSRLRETERRQAAHQLRLQPPASRVAAQFNERVGIWRAVATATITRASPGEVMLVYHNGTGYMDSGKRKVCMGYSLNTDETIAADQALWVIHLGDNTWEVFNGNCKIRDWLLEGEGA